MKNDSNDYYDHGRHQYQYHNERGSRRGSQALRYVNLNPILLKQWQLPFPDACYHHGHHGSSESELHLYHAWMLQAEEGGLRVGREMAEVFLSKLLTRRMCDQELEERIDLKELVSPSSALSHWQIVGLLARPGGVNQDRERRAEMLTVTKQLLDSDWVVLY